MAIRTRIPPLVLGLAVAWGCQTIVEELPQRPTGPEPAPIPVVVVPVPVPTANPNPPPAPNPGQNPPPAPGQPQPQPPSSQGCRVPPGNGSGTNCPRQNPSFLGDVEAALDQLVRSEPGIFDLNRAQGCSNCYYVANVSRYLARMPDMMSQRGLCARWDGEELAVKSSNAFNDQYDILTSGNFIRRQSGSYRATCYPAAF